MRRTATAIATALLLTGCGSSSEQDVADVVRDFHAASAEGDADRACRLVTADYYGEGRCPEFIELAKIDPYGNSVARKMAKAEWDVEIRDDEATAVNDELGRFALRREDGDWKLADSG